MKEALPKVAALNRSSPRGLQDEIEPGTVKLLKHREYEHPPASAGFGWLAKPHPNATAHPATPDGPPLIS